MFDASFDPITDPVAATSTEPPRRTRRWLASALTAAAAEAVHAPASPFARTARCRRAGCAPDGAAAAG